MRRGKDRLGTPTGRPVPQAIDPASGFKVRLKVFPSFPVNNVPNRVLGDTGIIGANVSQSLTSDGPLPNGNDISFEQFCASTCAALDIGNGKSATPLLLPIPNIISLSACKKMRRIHAGRIIAPMERKKIAQRLPALDFQRNPVGEKRAVVMRNYAVTIRIQSARPRPALLFRERWNHRPKLALDRAKWLHPTHSLENCSACFAGFRLKVHLVDRAISRLGLQGLSA